MQNKNHNIKILLLVKKYSWLGSITSLSLRQLNYIQFDENVSRFLWIKFFLEHLFDILTMKSKTHTQAIKQYLFIFAFLCSLAFAKADIYISEVLYNPFTTESGGEAVELYNSGNDAVDISGFIIRTASSFEDAEIPENAVIPAKGHYLIADLNWHTKKDDPSYPDADYEEAITMQNTNSGVALIDVNNNTLDKVGWGFESEIDPALFDQLPANYSENGESLRRISFTGNNNNDFISSVPQLVNSLNQSSDPQANVINIGIQVQNPDDQIINVSVDFDFEDKILLIPGQDRVVNVTFVTNNLDVENAYVDFLELQYTAYVIHEEGPYKYYQADVPIDFSQPSGNYSMTIVCELADLDIQKNLSFEILPLLAFELDLHNINCSLSSSQSCLISGDFDILTYDKPTLRNLGNTMLDFEVSGTNLTSGLDTIDVRNMKFAFDTSNPDNEVTNDPVLYDVELASGENIPLTLLIDIPGSSQSGFYSSRLTLMGVSGE